MAAIRPTRDYRRTFEDMIKAALFPPTGAYISFSDAAGAQRYPLRSRAEGRDSFLLFGGQSLYPLIGWWMTTLDISAYAAQSFEAIATVAVAIVASSTDLQEARDIVSTDLGRIEEACLKQISDASLPSGPFWYSDSTVIGGKAGNYYGLTKDPTFSDHLISAPDLDLGPTIVSGSIGVTIALHMD